MARRRQHLGRVLRTPLGISSAILLAVVLLLAVFAQIGKRRVGKEC